MSLISSAKSWVYYWGFMVALLLAAFFVANAWHELGHGLFALLVGGRFDGFYVSVFEESVSFTAIRAASPRVSVLVSGGGAIVTVPVGVLLYMVVYPRLRGTSAHAKFIVLTVAASFLVDTIYFFFSPIIAHGDAYAIANTLEIQPPQLVSMIMLLLVTAVYYPLFSRLFDLLSPFLVVKEGFWGRFMVMSSLFVVPVFLAGVVKAVVSLAFASKLPAVLQVALGGLAAVALIPAIVLVARRHSGTMTSTPSSIRMEMGFLQGLRRPVLVAVSCLAVASAVLGPTVTYAYPVVWSETPGPSTVEVNLFHDKNSVFPDALMTFKSRPIFTYYSEEFWFRVRDRPLYEGYAKVSWAQAMIIGGLLKANSTRFFPNATVTQVHSTSVGDTFYYDGAAHDGGSRVVDVKVTNLGIVRREADDSMTVIFDTQGFSEGTLSMFTVRFHGFNGRIVDFTPKDGVLADDGAMGVVWRVQQESYEVKLKPV